MAFDGRPPASRDGGRCSDADGGRCGAPGIGRIVRSHVAESEGFEPPSPYGLTDFKSAAFDRSANSPEIDILGFFRFAARLVGSSNPDQRAPASIVADTATASPSARFSPWTEG